MNIRHHLLAASLAVVCGAGFANPVASPQGVPGFGNATVVGLWHLNASLGPCNNPSVRHTFLALQTFHLGGTVTGGDTHPVSGQGVTQGVWSYDWRTRRYKVHMQFPRFVNDVYDGLQDIYIVNIDLSLHGDNLTGDVLAHMRNPDDSVRMELCGSLTGERIHVDY
ncbi:hypothetical protein RLIN73S_03455 [Rhodanobacter lindaniclasticus]